MTTSSEILLGSCSRTSDIGASCSPDLHWSKEALDFFGNNVPEFDSACHRLSLIGCRVERDVKSEEFLFGQDMVTETVRVYRPADTTLTEMNAAYDCEESSRSLYPQDKTEEAQRNATLAELKTVPPRSLDLAQLTVDIGTLYVISQPLGLWQEVFCTPQVKWGVSSSAAFRKVDTLDRRVLHALRLHPYDSDRPGSNLQGARLLRPIATANAIAKQYGWNLHFKPVKVTGSLHAAPTPSNKSTAPSLAG